MTQFIEPRGTSASQVRASTRTRWGGPNSRHKAASMTKRDGGNGVLMRIFGSCYATNASLTAMIARTE